MTVTPVKLHAFFLKLLLHVRVVGRDEHPGLTHILQRLYATVGKKVDPSRVDIFLRRSTGRQKGCPFTGRCSSLVTGSLWRRKPDAPLAWDASCQFFPSDPLR
jgi:hypothetical protein